MKSGVISARVDAAYETMVEKLRKPGESDGEFIRRAIDALAISDVEFDEFVQGELGQEDYGV